jgi:hypothetical protein
MLSMTRIIHWAAGDWIWWMLPRNHMMLQPFTIDDTTCKYVNGLTSGYLPTIYNNLPWIYDVNIYLWQDLQPKCHRDVLNVLVVGCDWCLPQKKCDRSEPTNSYICGTQVRSKNSLAIATGGWCLWTHDVPELHPSPGKGESWSFLGIIEKGLGNWKLWYNIMLGGTRSLWLHDAFTAY